jgi:hypothetical protein
MLSGPHTLHMVVRSETEMHIALSNSTVNLSIPNLIQILFWEKHNINIQGKAASNLNLNNEHAKDQLRMH